MAKIKLWKLTMSCINSEISLSLESLRKCIIEKTKKGIEIRDNLLKQYYELSDSIGYYVGISQEEFDALISLLAENYPITSLEFWGYRRYHFCSLEDPSSAIESLQLTETICHYPPLSIDKLKILANALLQNSNITTLILDGSEQLGIGATGVKVLADVLLKSPTLSRLELRGNKIGSQGIKIISEILRKNQTLTYLGLSGNNLNDQDIKLLTETLVSNYTLIEIDLSNNNFSDEAAILIANLIRVHPMLQRLNLQGNQIGGLAATAFQESLSINKTITHLHLGDNVENKIRDEIEISLKHNYHNKFHSEILVSFQKYKSDFPQGVLGIIEGYTHDSPAHSPKKPSFI